MRWLWLALALFSFTTGCGTECRPGTVFLSYDLSVEENVLKSVKIRVTVDGSTVESTPSNAKPSASVEVKFPRGYPTGKSVAFEVIGLDANGAAVAVGTAVATLPSGCAVVQAVSQGADLSDRPDLSSNGDLSEHDLLGIDQVTDDLSLPGDLTQSLTAPYLTGLSVSAGLLVPNFDPMVTEYHLDVLLSVQTLAVTASADSPATLTTNGVAVASSSASPPITLNLGTNTITVIVTGSGGSRSYTITAVRGEEVTYIKASNTQEQDSFGYSIALSGDTLAVGAYAEDSGTTGVNSTPDETGANSGAVYVFVRSGGAWSQQAYLKASNTETGDGFGISVALSGDTLAVGAHNEDSDSSAIKTTPTNAETGNAAINSGAAYVFVRSGSTWTQQSYLKSFNPGSNDEFGRSVAISGDTIVVGAANEDSSVSSTPTNESAANSGAAYVFVRSGTSWSQQAYLKASNIEGSDYFGTSVAISGNTVVVGAPFEDSGTTLVGSTPDETAADSGAAYVFVRSGSTWSQQAYVKASNTGMGDNFGGAVAIATDTLAIGATAEDGGGIGISPASDETKTNSGAVYVWTRSGTTWTLQSYVKASNSGANDNFGKSVALVGERLLVGAPFESSGSFGINPTPDETKSSAGAAYLFVRTGGLGGTWSQQSFIKASNPDAGDYFGWSVALSDSTIAAGAYREQSSTTGIDSTPDNVILTAGAVYCY